MCYVLTFPTLPALCCEIPNHIAKITMYFVCEEISAHPERGMAHCEVDECIPYGVFGSYRSKAECPHCMSESIGQPVLIVMDGGENESVGDQEGGQGQGQDDVNG